MKIRFPLLITACLLLPSVHLAIAAGAPAAAAGTAFAQAQQSYGAGQGPAYSAPYQSDRTGEYRPSEAPNFDALEDEDPRYGRAPSAPPVYSAAPSLTTGAWPAEVQPDAAPTELAPNLRRQEVAFVTKEPAGTLVVDTPNTYLYYVLGNGRAIRYGVRVGREGFTWTGVRKITRKAEWPDWKPPKVMIDRQPYLPRFMAGGPGNPLGARAMYLGETAYRIHGTNQPSTIGKFVSSGCIGMLNDDVSDLFDRVKVGTRVVVWPAGPRAGTATASAQPVPAPVASQAGGGTRPTVEPPLPAPVTVR